MIYLIPTIDLLSKLKFDRNDMKRDEKIGLPIIEKKNSSLVRISIIKKEKGIE